MTQVSIPAASVRLKELTKLFGSTRAVDRVSLTIEPGSMVALLGPSGCGKTTTLRMIAGLAEPSAGEIFLDDLFRGLRKDGFTYFKIDFLYGAAYEAGRYDPEVTGTQALRSGLKRIFDAVNPPGKPEKAFVLACGAPLMPIVGLVHGARTMGHDVIRRRRAGRDRARRARLRDLAIHGVPDGGERGQVSPLAVIGFALPARQPGAPSR